MTIITDDGLEYASQRLALGSVPKLDHIGVGTGSNEVNGADDLGNRVYSASTSNSNIDFLDAGSGGQTEAVIVVKGGTEVSANTDVSEVGVYAGDPTGSGTLVFIDSFSAVTVEDGKTEQFVMPLDMRRV